jgi:hypothetical protein
MEFYRLVLRMKGAVRSACSWGSRLQRSAGGIASVACGIHLHRRPNHGQRSTHHYAAQGWTNIDGVSCCCDCAGIAAQHRNRISESRLLKPEWVCR